MAYFTGDQSPLAIEGSALYPTNSQSFGAGNTATVFNLSLGQLQAAGVSASQVQPALFDAKSALIVLANVGTSQTINAATVVFTDTLDTLSPTITYTLPGVSIASGASQAFVVQLQNGILKNVSVNATYGSAPTAGSMAVLAVFSCTGDPLGVNTDLGTLVSASAVTTTQSSADQVNLSYKGVICVLNMSNAGTGSVTTTIQGKDSASSNYYSVAAGSAQTSNGTTFLALYPGASTAAPSGSTNVAGVLPARWRVQGVANNSNATTYTITAIYII